MVGRTGPIKQKGNFHERYLLDIINALQQKGRLKDAAKLRREWEKKVTYMVYEDPWPFGSEMFVDRTALSPPIMWQSMQS